jgi:hypothetical protein
MVLYRMNIIKESNENRKNLRPKRGRNNVHGKESF